MEIFFIFAVIGIIIMWYIGYSVGKKNSKNNDNSSQTSVLEEKIAILTSNIADKEKSISENLEEIKRLTSERDVQRAGKEHLVAQLEQQEQQAKNNIQSETERCDKLLKEKDCFYQNQIKDLKAAYEKQIEDLRVSYEKNLERVKENSNEQLSTLREMNRKQVEDQLTLIKEQMKTTSESVLKARQEELGEKNKEQVSRIIDPLQKSLKDMEEALNKSKEQQKEALTRLDETIKLNMEKSASLGETADRLTRALTGEVKVQGNFGELKLKQLLEDLELKEGEQYDSQKTICDKAGKSLKGDDGKGMVPDFILHFPNNRHVVVDSKMSLTDYERYMNSEDGTPEKRAYLKAHIDSVKAQIKRLAKKEYTKYLPDGYNRLTFAIMYIPIEGALNLALLNDTALWREAYDQGVMILGPQTMYMNLRVLEMMWTQVRQLNNQQAMMNAANMIIERVQDFGTRFIDVENSVNDTVKKISKLKITTSDSGPSIITAARNLLVAGARENKRKKSLDEMEKDNSVFIDADPTELLSYSKKEN
ncbi:MAG: DNA recombination protein RmuC [Prevotella sp.]